LDGDGSPAALGELNADARFAAFAPSPIILPVSDILFDAWALTTIRGKLPGRPTVEPYLHGISEWEPPETHVAWREEVGIIIGDLSEQYDPEGLLEDYPLKPHELLRDNSSRVFDRLKKLAADEESPVWVVSDDDSIDVTTIGKLVEAGKEKIEHKTILLPPAAGGLQGGMLTGDSRTADDVSDELWDENGQQRRIRVWDGAPAPVKMRRIRPAIDIKPDGEENGEEQTDKRLWNWFELPKDGDSDGSRSNERPVLWEVHVSDVVGNAIEIVGRLPLSEELRNAIVLAARFHDHGKKRKQFQAALGNFEYPGVLLAKSGKKGGWMEESYRHEFGSLLDVLDPCQEALAELETLTDEAREIVLHLIAVHHGHGRPHFRPELAFDPEPPADADPDGVAASVSQRFARLQRKYGRWGLAYLESLLRAADYAASAKPSAFVEEKA
jgi:CRISPR-associated endonuclease/helicase Cas3